MERILRLRNNVAIYIVDKKEIESLIDMNIKSDNTKYEVKVNHYTISDNRLKKIHKGSYDVLIREEVDRFDNTLIANAYVTNDYFKNGDFQIINSYLSKSALKVVS